MGTQSIELMSSVPTLGLSRPIYLMCSPKLYDVAYVINPWMADNLHRASREHATSQWNSLYQALAKIADIKLIDPKPGSPDMVFTANAGLERDGIVIVSQFFHPERQGEEEHFRHWFRESGYTVVNLPQNTPFEGEGDALFSEDGSRLWAGYGMRSAQKSHVYLMHTWNIEVTPLHLVDPCFYHLDTCFAPLNRDYVMYYPPAFDSESIAQIEAFYPFQKRIAVSREDAEHFACNVINIGNTILLNEVSKDLTLQLEAAGFHVVSIAFSEFIKAGGAAKCLVMKLGPLVSFASN